MNPQNPAPNTQQGVLLALCAYGFWAIAPVYFKWIQHISALEILSHRVIWSFLLTLAILLLTKRWGAFMAAVKNARIRGALIISTLLIAFNWGLFIWAINDNRMLSASLGYYINPLINILFGLLFFGEKMTKVRGVASVLCLIAVIFEVVQFGRLPWIALSLAISFALYGLVRKKIAVDSFVGMGLETGLMLPLAIAYLFISTSATTLLWQNNVELNVLLFLAGPVTMFPLLCFAAAANRISMAALGFFQYIGPTGMFFLAVFVYDEPLVPSKLVTFGLIWTALAVLVVNSLIELRKGKTKKTGMSLPAKPEAAN